MKRLILFLILAGLPLLAQAPRGFFPWWDSPIAKDLNLSDDQQRQIRSIVREYRVRMIEQRAAVERAEAELEDFYNDEAFDSRKATEAADRLVNARGELTRSMSVMGIRLRAVLTPDQYKDLQKRRPRAQPGQLMRELQKRRQGEGRINQGPGAPPPQSGPHN